MNIMYITLIIIVFIICVTILIYRIIDYHFEKAEGMNSYWHGRYLTLWEIFNNAVKYELSNDIMEEIENIKSNN